MGLLAVAAAAVLLTCLYGARTPILRAIGAQLVHTDELQPADAIVVLAGGVPERELEAADLFRTGLAPRVVLTQEPEHPGIAILKARGIAVPRELDERRRYLRELGVPDSAVVILPGRAESTRWEAQALVSWAQKVGAKTLIVVTSAFHTGRASLVFEDVFEDSGVRILMRPASSDTFTPDSWWRDRVTLRNGIIEWQKQLGYRLGY